MVNDTEKEGLEKIEEAEAEKKVKPEGEKAGPKTLRPIIYGILILAVVVIGIFAFNFLREKPIEQEGKVPPELQPYEDEWNECLDDAEKLEIECRAFVAQDLSLCEKMTLRNLNPEDAVGAQRRCLGIVGLFIIVVNNDRDKCLELQDQREQTMCSAILEQNPSLCSPLGDPCFGEPPYQAHPCVIAEECRLLSDGLIGAIEKKDIAFCEKFNEPKFGTFIKFCPLLVDSNSISCDDFVNECNDNYYLKYAEIIGKSVCAKIVDDEKRIVCEEI